MNDGKRRAAEKALDWVHSGMVVGVGSGSTVELFIDALGRGAVDIAGAVSSSEKSTARLRALGIKVLDLAAVEELAVYVDGADEFDPAGHLIKGGGGALTREKILAEASRTFVCIVDASKRVDVLGAFPLPIEVIPMARVHVARTLSRLTGGAVVWRQGFVTDNGNDILDVHGLRIEAPGALERSLNAVPGIVTVGLFARRKADVLVIGTDPVEILRIAT